MKKNRTTHFMAGIMIILFVGVFLVLTGRFLYIQATGEVNDVSLQEWAEEKRTTSFTLESERGKIYDKNGMTLAYDMPVYRLYAIVQEAYSTNLDNPQHVVDPEETAEKIAPIIEADEGEILERLESGMKNDAFQVEFGNEGRELSQQQKEDIEALELPGINLEKESIRYYPNGMFASHIIGFARESETEDGVAGGITGVVGMEDEMEELLSGKNGKISYQRDKYNKKLLDPKEVITMPEDGDDVYLTIDQKIQTLLEDTLTEVNEIYNPERITAVVMNPKSGEILAMSNRPSYNPNDPSDVENWYNDVISTPVEPGSSVKMFTWAAAIEEGVYSGEETFESGSYTVNERIQPINDHNQGEGWGSISYNEGFRRSSNVAAAKLLWEKIGADTYLEYLEAFDLDQPTGIDLPGEVPGQILYNWPLEKITTSFGQGSTMTPIQQMKAATAIANGGKMFQPYVIQRVVDSSTGETLEEKKPNVVGEPISKETSEKVLKLLESVVNGENGTGKMYQLDDYTVGGKTGTAQIPNPDPGSGPYLTGRENYIFSFLGMAPMDDPKLMMYVSVKQPELDETESGSAPVSFIFNNVMENSLHYLNIEPDKEQQDKVRQMEIPKLVGADAASVEDSLKELGLTVTVMGKGNVVTANVSEGDAILPGDHIMLVANEPEMPDISGWSRREVLQLTELLELKTETFGHGFVATQNISEGTPIKKGDYLGVEFVSPHDTEETESVEDEGEEAEE
ncbi:penicillin-binding protein [Virgibacillus sp. YIM 98842]|jgi:penicillin-binding protein 2B|uniref:penicillin-binding protein n=1 Tax=Virgibacillus sp. YIM 98842 TaxID=2663533 RepID=UPI0013D9FB0F|nr:penicillin-binding protein [Virgibacillus sp. YIM 98842]